MKTSTDACQRNVQESKLFLTAITAVVVFSKEFYGLAWSQLYQNAELTLSYAVILTSALAFSVALVLSFTLERAGYALMSSDIYAKHPRINEWMVGSKLLSVIVNVCLLFGIPLFLAGFFSCSWRRAKRPSEFIQNRYPR